MFVATGSDDRTVRLWDIRSAHCTRVFSAGCKSTIASVAISNSGEIVAAGTDSRGDILTWDVGTGRLLLTLNTSVDSTILKVNINTVGSVLVSGGSDGAVRVWDLSRQSDNNISGTTVNQSGDNSMIHPYRSFFSKNCPIYDVGFSTDGFVYAGGPSLSGNYDES